MEQAHLQALLTEVRNLKRDLQRLEDLRMGRIMPGEEGEISSEMLIAKSRQKRSEYEHSELQSEIDRVEGEERREHVRAMIKKAKEESENPLSRAEVLFLFKISKSFFRSNLILRFSSIINGSTILINSFFLFFGLSIFFSSLGSFVN